MPGLAAGLDGVESVPGANLVYCPVQVLQSSGGRAEQAGLQAGFDKVGYADTYQPHSPSLRLQHPMKQRRARFEYLLIRIEAMLQRAVPGDRC